MLSFRYVLAMSSARIRYSAVFFFTASLLRGLTSPDAQIYINHNHVTKLFALLFHFMARLSASRKLSFSQLNLNEFKKKNYNRIQACKQVQVLITQSDSLNLLTKQPLVFIVQENNFLALPSLF